MKLGPLEDDMGLSWEHYRAEPPRVEPLDHTELPPHPTEDVRTDYLSHPLVPESFYSIAQLNQQYEQQRSDVKRKWSGDVRRPEPSVGYSSPGDSVDIAWWMIYAGLWIVIDVVLIVVWVVGWFTRMRF